MIDKDKYQKLKKVIQEANPEIMELKFGCNAIWDNSLGDDIPCTIIEKSYKNYWVIGLKSSEGDSLIIRSVKRREIKEILGREIRLADVLIALDKVRNIHIAVGTPGWLYNVEILVLQSREETWDLLQNNLDLQSDRLKQGLIDLLVSKEEPCKD